MRVIGTAGHVDHGKSTLVKRLTGIDPDRLAEEKAREMTIDLGFAWLTLPNGETLGIVDVPGHRDFIENMLAGVGGIDAVLLVIAADEGIMPQTREHLAILDLLGIQNGLIILTKIDLIDDVDWLDLIENEIRDAISHTTLAKAEIVRVSAHSGAGMSELVEKISLLLADLPPNTHYNTPRLPIDRVFTISGFGTVVTGTLLGGTLRVGDEIEIQPVSLRGRIRGLQSYKQPVEIAQPGSRVAVNVAGIEKSALERGFVLTQPRQLQPTLLVDVSFHHLKDASRPLKHHSEAKLFVGAAESTVRVRLLNDEILPPGAESWLQLRLEKPLALAQGDRFILRYPSPGETIGGGIVVNPQPGRRWKRFQASLIEQLETRLRGTPDERVTQAASQFEPVKRAVLQKATGYSDTELDSAIQDAIAQGILRQLPDNSYVANSVWQGILRRIENELIAFHNAEPLRRGMPREELRSRLGLKQAILTMLLAEQNAVVAENNHLRMADHEILLSDAQQNAIRALYEQMDAAPYTPPSYADATNVVGENVLRALIELGEIMQVQTDVIFSRQVYDHMVAELLSLIDQNGQVTAAELRNRFNTTRKYAIGLLEHLDSAGITKRAGDARVRGRP
jgi:selenocysteine-specific elongation factor